MDPDIEALLKQKSEIEKQIEQIAKEKKAKAIAEVKKIIEDYNIREDEIFGGKARKSRKSLPPKYRDPATGKTWSGKGRAPRWFDKDKAKSFLI